MPKIGALSVLIPLCVIGTTAQAEDASAVGMAIVEDRCLVTDSGATVGDAFRPTESAGGIVGTLLGGLAGDVFAAAGNALGGALREASRRRTFSAEAVASFDFYEVVSHQNLLLASRLKEQESLCLMMSVPGNDAGPFSLEPLLEGPDVTVEESQLATNWGQRGFSPRPSFYMEAELQRRADGFRIRPVLVWYRSPMPGAPRRTLPTEIHITFSTPSAPSADAPEGDVFAAARMRLPALQPGTSPMFAPQLFSLASIVLPARPTSDSPDTVRTALQDALTAEQENREEVERLERELAQAQGDVRRTLEASLRAARARTPQLQAAANAARGQRYPLGLGSTNVNVRFAVVRNENAFGMALADALQTRTRTAGEAISAELTPRSRQQAWSDEDTTYVTRMNEVESAQRALELARQGGDPETVFTAEQSLRVAKAHANAAAASAGRAIPFPNL